MQAGPNRLEDNPIHAAKAKPFIEGHLPPIPVTEAKHEETLGIIDMENGHLYQVNPMIVTDCPEPDLVTTGTYRPPDVGILGNGTGLRRAMTTETEAIEIETRGADTRSGETPIAGIPTVDLPIVNADLTGNPAEGTCVIDIPIIGNTIGSEIKASIDMADTVEKDWSDTERGTGLGTGKPTSAPPEKPLSDDITIKRSEGGDLEAMILADLADRMLDPKQESREGVPENRRKETETRAGISRIHLRPKDQLIEYIRIGCDLETISRNQVRHHFVLCRFKLTSASRHSGYRTRATSRFRDDVQ